MRPPPIHPVILCGGSGTRLWPSSRKSYPKQFSRLLGPESLFQATARRFAAPGFAAPIVMTNAAFRFLATDQLHALGLTDASILIEPVGRNTGPAVLTAALSLEATPDALMLVAPSDHLIDDDARFRAAVETGAADARAGALVTFGVPPARAETGYGYLEIDPAARDRAGPDETLSVLRFVEKPDAGLAEGMATSGAHFWNAGVFLFRVDVILAAFKAHAPALIEPCAEALATGAPDLDFFRLGAAAYARAESISLDYAVMERAGDHPGDIVAAPYGGGWSDLGSWDAIWEALARDDDGVATSGGATAIDCRDTLLRSEEEDVHLVGLGLTNVIAVAMRDAVLVADMSAAQDVKRAVATLKASGVGQAESFPRFHRPWGWYETLCSDAGFRVKRIMVKPGGALSLQSHQNRSEHWVVVAGAARVTIGEDISEVRENQSIYVPLGARHRLQNPGAAAMYLIEVQTGVYLGEDDITRYEDGES